MERLSAVPDSDKPRVLILGGTAEAAALARALVDGFSDQLDITTSLAGRTRAPTALPGRVRSGGFGGAAAMADYLKEQQIAALIDATHPFAAQISANAQAACETANVPRLVLSRPSWSPRPGDNWSYFDTIEAAAENLTGFGRRAFLTVGVQELKPFAALQNIWFLVRLIEQPTDPLPFFDCKIIAGRGPFSVEREQALMASHKIEVLVTKASGGNATAAKLAAARLLSLPVVLVRRPPAPAGPSVDGIPAVLDWILLSALDPMS